MLRIVIAIVILLALTGSGWGYINYGVVGGAGPIGLLLLVVGVLFVTGNLRTV